MVEPVEIAKSLTQDEANKPLSICKAAAYIEKSEAPDIVKSRAVYTLLQAARDHVANKRIFDGMPEKTPTFSEINRAIEAHYNDEGKLEKFISKAEDEIKLYTNSVVLSNQKKGVMIVARDGIIGGFSWCVFLASSVTLVQILSKANGYNFVDWIVHKL